MRQAGRYMEDYRALRAQYGFLELCKRPDLAAEITVTPVERLKVDAAILFADILLILEPMGVGLEYSKGDGPVIHRPVRSGKDVDALKDFDPEKELSFVYEAVKKTRAALDDRVPLIGFAGAPFTLASYLIEGAGSRNYIYAKKLYYTAPEIWHHLLQRLSQLITKYLNCQIAAGAQAVQLFDSWAGCLTPGDYERFRSAVYPRGHCRDYPGCACDQFQYWHGWTAEAHSRSGWRRDRSRLANQPGRRLGDRRT